jgi:hypothetical protein
MSQEREYQGYKQEKKECQTEGYWNQVSVTRLVRIHAKRHADQKYGRKNPAGN